MNEDSSVFKFDHYKTYLKKRIGQLPKGGRGFRSQLATALDCQTGYISQVLNGAAEFSLEQAIVVNRLLVHSDGESRFFILLVQHARAGSRDLQLFFAQQIEEAREKHSLIRERFKVKKDLLLEEQLNYYGDWFIAAIHVLTSIPSRQTPAAIAEGLQLPVSQILRALEFLIRCGLVQSKGGIYSISNTRLHLSSESPLISKHHINWRLQAMRSLERQNDRDLHYTSIVSVAAEDVGKIRTLLIDTLEQYNKRVSDSPEEECHCLALDFFRVV